MVWYACVQELSALAWIDIEYLPFSFLKPWVSLSKPIEAILMSCKSGVQVEDVV